MKKIELEGAKNIRDFGGTMIGNRYRIKEDQFIRSNSLAGITEEDARKLEDHYRLRKIIDLRTTQEVREKPDRKILGAKWMHLPLFDASQGGITHEKETDENLPPLDDFIGFYTHMVTNPFSVSKLREVFGEITKQENGSVLWHCTEGKDRCGIVSALFLFLLGGDENTVMEDYLMTNQTAKKRAEDFYEKVLRETGNEKRAEFIRKVYVADSSYLEGAIDSMKKNYGSVDGFLREGLSIEESSRISLQKRILE